MSIKRTCIALCLIIVCLFSSVNIAEAYVKEAWRFLSKSVNFKWGDRLTISGSTIRNGWESANAAWKSASSFNFTVSSSSSNILNSWFESSTTKYGRMTTTYNTSTKRVVKFVGEMNAGNSNISKTNVAKSVGVYELGHAIGIGHNSGTSIMNSGRDRTKMHVPQTDDKNGVNAIY